MAEIDSGLALDEWQKELLENAANPAPLHPELVAYVVRANSVVGFDVLKHPLVFAVPYTPAMNWMYNKSYEAKAKGLCACVAKEDWSHYIALHERPYRFDAFEAICYRLDGKAYWDLLSWIWSDSENLWQVGYKRIRRLLSRHLEHRGCFMDEREQKLLGKLPDRIRVFRGHKRQNQKGFSWSLAYVNAVWFGRRFASEGCGLVSQGVVQKSDVIGLILGRNEMEVVVDPRHVKGLEVMQPILRSKELEQLRREMVSRFHLTGRTYHGPDHWEKVERNGMKLCELVPGADEMVVRLFAICHDSCRQNENHDPQHGPRAADLVKRMYEGGRITGITEDQFTKLEFACRHHNGSKPVSDPTIGVCFDADRLDLLRVGIVPKPALLSTEAARGLIGVI